MTSFIFIKYLFKFNYMKKFIFVTNSKLNHDFNYNKDELSDDVDEDGKPHTLIIPIRIQVLF